MLSWPDIDLVLLDMDGTLIGSVSGSAKGWMRNVPPNCCTET